MASFDILYLFTWGGGGGINNQFLVLQVTLQTIYHLHQPHKGAPRRGVTGHHKSLKTVQVLYYVSPENGFKTIQTFLLLSLRSVVSNPLQPYGL